MAVINFDRSEEFVVSTLKRVAISACCMGKEISYLLLWV